MIDYTCLACGAEMRSPDSLAGKQETCPDCGQTVQVPKAGVQEKPRPTETAKPVSRSAEPKQGIIDASRTQPPPLPLGDGRPKNERKRTALYIAGGVGTLLLIVGIFVAAALIARRSETLSEELIEELIDEPNETPEEALAKIRSYYKMRDYGKVWDRMDKRSQAKWEDRHKNDSESLKGKELFIRVARMKKYKMPLPFRGAFQTKSCTIHDMIYGVQYATLIVSSYRVTSETVNPALFDGTRTRSYGYDVFDNIHFALEDGIWKQHWGRPRGFLYGKFSETNVLLEDYWQALQELMIERKSAIRPRNGTILPLDRLEIHPLGRLYIEASVNLQDRFIEIACCGRGGPSNGQVFHYFLEHKRTIERDIGHSLQWDELPDRRGSRISFRKTDVSPTNRDDWPTQHRWMAEQLEAFYKGFSAPSKELTETTNWPSWIYRQDGVDYRRTHVPGVPPQNTQLVGKWTISRHAKPTWKRIGQPLGANDVDALGSARKTWQRISQKYGQPAAQYKEVKVAEGRTTKRIIWLNADGTVVVVK